MRLLVPLILLLSTTASGHEVKLAYVDTAALLAIMPGREAAMEQLVQETKELEAVLQRKMLELEQRQKNYVEREMQMLDAVKATEIRELDELQTGIRAFQREAERQLQSKDRELMAGLEAEARAAIERVAKANGYAVVLDAHNVVYGDASLVDLTPLVKREIAP